MLKIIDGSCVLSLVIIGSAFCVPASSYALPIPEDDASPKAESTGYLLSGADGHENQSVDASGLVSSVTSGMAGRGLPQDSVARLLTPPALILPEQAAPMREVWQELPAPDASGRKVQNKTEGPWVTLSAQTACSDSTGDPDNPRPNQNWHSDEAVRLSLTSSLFVFSQVGAGCESMTSQETRVMTRTGVEYKLPAWTRGELLVRGGPSLSCDDSLHPERAQEHSELLLEVQGKWPVWNQLKLEYSGSAVPALHPAEHDHLTHDVAVAFPLIGGQVRLGAKHNIDYASETKINSASSELYMGFSLTR
jgi:hypothetical protein